MLQLDHVTKTYGRQTAVAELSFGLQPGEVVGFLGPNGAGKSSTLKMISGYLQPDSGRITIGGMDATHRPPEARRRIGYLPEHNPLYLDMYVREALRYAAALAGVPPAMIRQRVADVIERTGLGPEAHKPLAALSKGYRQRTGIAQALLHDPDLLILDEPTSGLDPNQVLDIRQLIRELGQTKAVLFSSHILQEVEAVATRVLILHRGRLRYDGPLQLQSDAEVLEVEFARDGFDFGALEADGKLSYRTGEGLRWQLTPAPDVDLRPLLVAESVRQDNPLRSLTQPEANLAQLFRRLTMD